MCLLRVKDMTDDIKDEHPVAKRTQKGTDAVSKFAGFYANDHHAFVVRKAERLASALHIVTGFISPDEPIRVRLRNAALDLVQHSTRMETLSHLGPDGFGSRCAEIATLLDTAQAAGMVSAMNAKMISDEYADLAAFIRDRYAIIRTRLPEFNQTPPAPSPLEFYKGQKDIAPYRTNNVFKASDKGHNDSGRQKDILALFSDRERISIKDATTAIPGVSEKTIQRELSAMVEAGTLIREGERRWSTYRKAVQG